MLFLYPIGNFPIQSEEGKWEVRSRNAFPRILAKVEKADVLVGEKNVLQGKKKTKSKFRRK